MIRSQEGLAKALGQIQSLRKEFWAEACVPGRRDDKNQELEKAGRVGDFLELAELMALDALIREESCGCHFRVEHQTKEHEAKRNDEKFAHVSAWQLNKFEGAKMSWTEHRERLFFEKVSLSQRNYK